MKRLLWVSPIVLVLISVSAFADSITIGLAPNFGGGDNFGFTERGPGLFAEVLGGTPFDFFNIGPYAPGSTWGGGTDVFIDNPGGALGFATINGVSYDIVDAGGNGGLFIDSFTLPTNGKDFSITVEASFSASVILSNGQTLDVGGSAPGRMVFNFSPGEFDCGLTVCRDGAYFPNPVVFTTVPEPTTLGLMGTGLVGIFAFARERLVRLAAGNHPFKSIR
jgi:PEP-CTERM motif